MSSAPISIKTKLRLILALLAMIIMTHQATCAEVVRKMIDLSDAQMVHTRRPILIAHRGGVITSISPECSLAAIEAAAHDKYDMVELDVQETSDHLPVVFHDRSMLKACGIDSKISEKTLSEITQIRYIAGGQPVASLEDALHLCKKLNLGIMLDIKLAGSETFFERIRNLITEIGFPNAVVTINGNPVIRKNVESISWLTVTNEEFKRVQEGESLDLKRRFWFGLPQDLPVEMIRKLHDCGALVIPGVNIFRYPGEVHLELAKKDIEDLNEHWVDGFQIDSVYRDFFREK